MKTSEEIYVDYLARQELLEGVAPFSVHPDRAFFRIDPPSFTRTFQANHVLPSPHVASSLQATLALDRPSSLLGFCSTQPVIFRLFFNRRGAASSSVQLLSLTLPWFRSVFDMTMRPSSLSLSSDALPDSSGLVAAVREGAGEAILKALALVDPALATPTGWEYDGNANPTGWMAPQALARYLNANGVVEPLLKVKKQK